MTKKILIALVGLGVLMALPVAAATFKVAEIYEHKGGVITDDLYLAGGSVDVSGDVEGDLLVAGGEIKVIGDVSEDVTATGGSIDLLGSVGGDARGAGGNISVASKIGDDLVVVGGFVKVLSDSIISGDAVIAGGAVVVNGSVVGDLTVYGEEVTINGPVNGNVTLRFTEVITIGEDASIAGNLTYSADEEIELPEGVFVGGEMIRVESSLKGFKKSDVAGGLGVLLVGKLILMLVTGVLAVLVFKRFSTTIGEGGHSRFWKHALVGFVTLIVVPVAIFLLFLTIIGSYVGLLLLGTYLLLLFIAKVYAGIVAGAILSKWTMKKVTVDWKWAILGIFALQIIGLVPLFGTFIVFVIAMASFGTINMLVYKRLWLDR